MSEVKTAKTFSHDSQVFSYTAGQQVSCYDCHNGPQAALQTGSAKLAVKGGAGKSAWSPLDFLADLGNKFMAWVRELSLQA